MIFVPIIFAERATRRGMGSGEGWVAGQAHQVRARAARSSSAPYRRLRTYGRERPGPCERARCLQLHFELRFLNFVCTVRLYFTKSTIGTGCTRRVVHSTRVLVITPTRHALQRCRDIMHACCRDTSAHGTRVPTAKLTAAYDRTTYSTIRST